MCKACQDFVLVCSGRVHEIEGRNEANVTLRGSHMSIMRKLCRLTMGARLYYPGDKVGAALDARLESPR